MFTPSSGLLMHWCLTDLVWDQSWDLTTLAGSELDISSLCPAWKELAWSIDFGVPGRNPASLDIEIWHKAFYISLAVQPQASKNYKNKKSPHSPANTSTDTIINQLIIPFITSFIKPFPIPFVIPIHYFIRSPSIAPFIILFIAPLFAPFITPFITSIHYPIHTPHITSIHYPIHIPIYYPIHYPIHTPMVRTHLLDAVVVVPFPDPVRLLDIGGVAARAQDDSDGAMLVLRGALHQRTCQGEAMRSGQGHTVRLDGQDKATRADKDIVQSKIRRSGQGLRAQGKTTRL